MDPATWIVIAIVGVVGYDWLKNKTASATATGSTSTGDQLAEGLTGLASSLASSIKQLTAPKSSSGGGGGGGSKPPGDQSGGGSPSGGSIGQSNDADLSATEQQLEAADAAYDNGDTALGDAILGYGEGSATTVDSSDDSDQVGSSASPTYTPPDVTYDQLYGDDDTSGDDGGDDGEDDDEEDDDYGD
jgi:hypothetical protein